MDFLYLVCLYGLMFIVAFLGFLYRGIPALNSGIIGSFRHQVSNILMLVVPESFQHAAVYIFTYLLYKRNSVFQVIFLVLNMAFHFIGVYDMIPILQKHYPHHNHIIWPVVAAFVNFYFWRQAWIGDAGVVTPSNHHVYNNIYDTDGVFYTEGVVCSTCKLVKPARSKHCSTCDRCVHRFDHHCIWTDNCVGGLNHGYFILFMGSLMVVFIQAFYKGTLCVLLHADDIKLMTTSFIDTDGSIRPITLSVAFQHLFLTLPRLVFLCVSLVVLILLLGVFLAHHIYLLLSNQTTNERHKLASLYVKRASQATGSYNQSRNKEDNLKHSKLHRNSHSNNSLLKVMSSYHPYSRGMLNNFLEVFMPNTFIEERLKMKNK